MTFFWSQIKSEYGEPGGTPTKNSQEYPPGLRASLLGGGVPQVGEVTRGGSPHLSCKPDQIKMTDYMDRRVASGLPQGCLRVAPAKRVTSPTLGSPTSMLTGPKTKIVHFTTLFKTRETIFYEPDSIRFAYRIKQS